MLIELMVGLAVAAIAIGAAIVTLLVARDAASSVNELAQLQRDASHALRVLSLQIRAAGSNELQASSGNPGYFRFVVNGPTGEDPSKIHGTDGTTGASDRVHLIQTSPPLLPSQQRDCLGQEAASGSRIETTFQLDAKGNLQCKGASAKPQPLVPGVAAFKLRYRVRQGEQIRSLPAAEVEAAQLWPAVTALEVCLELQGQARPGALEADYVDCLNRSASTGGRLRLVTRKVFALNAQAKA